MDQPQKIHLFNCDTTYKLDVVESLLTAVKPKLDFKFSVEKHYFPLSQMAEMSTETIPELQMDFAIFVVHANESRLSINEENAGIGYAKVYRALLQATGEKVIVVIGGDDNYKNEDEEEHVVLSRWSRRKVSSQFTEEFMDGRKSFIFSWDKKHRPIHEEALLHYFGKTGLKFDYQPKPKLPAKPANQSSVKTELVETKLANQPLATKTDDRPIKGSTIKSGAEQPARRELPKSDFYNRPEQSREEKGRSSTRIPDSGQGARTKVHHDLVILDCITADESIPAVRQVIKDLRPKLNLSTEPPVKRGTAVELNAYFMMNAVRFCLLVVDAETIKDAYENLPQRKEEYRQLLETATEEVGEMVFVTVCGPCSLPPCDQTSVTLAIKSILDKKNKGFMVWLKGGKLQMGTEVLLRIMSSIAISEGSSPKASDPAGVVGASKVSSVPCSQDPLREPPLGSLVTSQSTNLPFASNPPLYRIPGGELVHALIKAHLRKGRISFEEGDVWCQDLEVPEYITTSLMEKHSKTTNAEVLLFLDKEGEKVIVVIGRDDNYKSEDEEERVVLSRWSRRKVSSQFTEEFMDGRKSFIFSWDRKHRPIHEEALLHYFDKTGLKFEYQPKPKIQAKPANQSPVKIQPTNQSPVTTKPANQSPVKAKPANQIKRGHSADEAGAMNVSPFPGVSSGQGAATKVHPSTSEKHEPMSCPGARLDDREMTFGARLDDRKMNGATSKSGTEKPAILEVLKRYLFNKREESREKGSYSGTRPEESGRSNTGIPDSEQGAGPKVRHPSTSEKHGPFGARLDDREMTFGARLDDRKMNGATSKSGTEKPAILEVLKSYLFNKREESREKGSYSGTRPEESGRSNTGIPDSEQGAGPKVRHPSTSEKHDLVILDCNTADESISAVKQVIEELRPKLNLSTDHPVVRGTAVELNAYLMMNSVRFCLLVVDAKTVKDAYENSQRRMGYNRLLETASKEVEEKVVVTVCGPCSLPDGDEERVNHAITRILDKKNKGFMVWLEEGKLQMGPEVLLQIMSSIANTGSSNPKMSNPASLGGASKVPSVPCSHDPLREPLRGSFARSYSADGSKTSQSTNQPVAPNGPVLLTSQGELVRVLVKTHLRKGRIHYEEGDFWLPDWKVPEYITINLLKKYSKTNKAELLLFLDDNGFLQERVTPKFCFGINPDEGEYQGDEQPGQGIVTSQSTNLPDVSKLLLYRHQGESVRVLVKAHLRKGRIDYKEGDIWFQDWNVPEYITSGLLRKYFKTIEAELLLFIDKSGVLKCRVKR